MKACTIRWGDVTAAAVAALLVLCLAACAGPDAKPQREAEANAAAARQIGEQPPVQSPAPLPPPVPAAPPPPPPVLPFDDAVQFAARSLFAEPVLPAPGADGKHPLVIDPLVDGASAVRSIATQAAEARIAEWVRRNDPKYDVQAFNTATLIRGPLLLIGTITPVDKEGNRAGAREWYRLCLALIDLRSGRIVSKGLARASTDGIDVTPTAFFLDSPAWAPDPPVDGYVKSCEGAKVHDPMNPAYFDRLFASAQINDAILAYNAGRYDVALDICKGLVRTGAGDQLRVHNGLYVASWKLGRRAEATEAFGRLVEFGLAQNRLGVNFAFRPAAATFAQDPKLTAPYPGWIKQIGAKIAQRAACVEVSGHTSRAGSESVNDRLSLGRAQYVKQLLDASAPQLKPRTSAVGKGSRENLVGIGTNDARDLLDRRVEFSVTPCSKP